MIETQVTKIELYDDAATGRSITYKTQRVGTGEDAGLTGPPVATAITPGVLVPSDAANAIDGKVYQRTDITEASGIPLEIRNIATGCWSEVVYTAHESKLRT